MYMYIYIERERDIYIYISLSAWRFGLTQTQTALCRMCQPGQRCFISVAFWIDRHRWCFAACVDQAKSVRNRGKRTVAREEACSDLWPHQACPEESIE